MLKHSHRHDNKFITLSRNPKRTARTMEFRATVSATVILSLLLLLRWPARLEAPSTVPPWTPLDRHHILHQHHRRGSSNENLPSSCARAHNILISAHIFLFPTAVTSRIIWTRIIYVYTCARECDSSLCIM